MSPSERDGHDSANRRQSSFGMGTGMNSNPVGAFGGRGAGGTGGASPVAIAVTLVLLLIAGVIIAFIVS